MLHLTRDMQIVVVVLVLAPGEQVLAPNRSMFGRIREVVSMFLDSGIRQ